MIQIVLLDPHPVVQKGFKTFFNKKDHIKVLGTFSKTQQLFDFLQKNTIDIVIIEMELKDVSAVQTVRTNFFSFVFPLSCFYSLPV